MAVPYNRLIKEHGLSPEKLKPLFTIEDGFAEKKPEVKKLCDQNRDQIRAGIDRNRRDYRLFRALDWARDTDFYQISFTQLRGLLSSAPDDKKVLETINTWGLAHMLPEEIGVDGKVCCDVATGKPKKLLNLPVFTNIFIPLVVAYVTIRWAKLFNERDLVPLLKYEPVQFTKQNRARCEILTQLVQRQSAQFDYKSDLRQHILQTLHYGFCIEFPREAWFVEKQEDESGNEKIVREGLRFNLPHPSRVYYDLYHRLSTLNSNTGCEYAGYWELCRYGSIKDHPLYWNKDKISFGSIGWFDTGANDFLEQVFPCQMRFPDTTRRGIGGTGPLDRQSELSGTFYNTNDYDAAALKTQHFRRLVPAEHGMGSYKYPVWFRFVHASDNAVLYAEPLAFDKLPTSAYDADYNKGRFNSLALEALPFQDHIGNLFSQWIFAVRENLNNPVFYDKDKVTEEAVRELRNLGNKTVSGRRYIPFSSTERYRMNENQREAFFTPQLTHHTVGEIAQLISGVLDMLERILQFSSQELGQPASHEQTAEESRIIARYTANRVQLTGSFIDDAVYAKKCVIYDANMAHADDSITVGVSSSFAATEAEFKKLMDSLGFSIQDDGTDPNEPDAMRTVKGSKSALQLETFASTRDASNRIDNPAIADAMSKIFLAIANNPVLIQSLGPVQLVELLNQIVVAAGLPKEFRLKGKMIDTAASQEEQAGQVSELLTKFAEQVKGAMNEAQKQTLEAAGQQTAQIVQQAMQQAGQQTSQALSGIAEGLAQQGQTNEQQEQQMQQLALVVAQLNQRIQGLEQATGRMAQALVAPGALQVQ